VTGVARKTRLPNATLGRHRDDAAAHADQRRGTGRTVRGRKSREALLHAARAVFERQGFLHTRIADICAEAGMSHGSFYTYFDSKEEVFQKVIDSVELDLLTLDPSPPDADPVERIRAANRHFLETYRDNAGILRVIEQVVTFDEDALETRRRRDLAFAAALEKRTRQYQEAGLIDERIDPRIASQALGGMVFNFANYLYAQGRPAEHELDAVVEQLTLLWVNALGMQSTEPRRPHVRSIDTPRG
jgi:AcrR family transcriptional regulator